MASVPAERGSPKPCQEQIPKLVHQRGVSCPKGSKVPIWYKDVQSMVSVVVTSLMVWVSIPHMGTLDPLGVLAAAIEALSQGFCLSDHG